MNTQQNMNAQLNTMNAQPILDKILADAREAASQTLKDANQKAGELRKQSEKILAAQRSEVTRRAQKDAAEQEERMLRMAQLEARKALLAKKRALIDDAFVKALASLHAMPAADARAYHLSLIAKEAQGGEELFVGMPTPAWYDDAFLAEANALLKKAGKAPIVKGAETQPVNGGFLLKKDGLELNCTYEALLKTRRVALEGEVAAMLFP